MKIVTVTAVLAAMLASPAFAQATPSTAAMGHYQWQVSPEQQAGPRAPLLAPVKVWVGPEMASHKDGRTMKRCCAGHPAPSGDKNQNS